MSLIKSIINILGNKIDIAEINEERQKILCNRVEDGARIINAIENQKSDWYIDNYTNFKEIFNNKKANIPKGHSSHFIRMMKKVIIEGYEYYGKDVSGKNYSNTNKYKFNDFVWTRTVDCNCKLSVDPKMVTAFEIDLIDCIRYYLIECGYTFLEKLTSPIHCSSNTPTHCSSNNGIEYNIDADFGSFCILVRNINQNIRKVACISCGTCMGFRTSFPIVVNGKNINIPSDIKEKDIGKFLIADEIEKEKIKCNEKKIAQDICAE